MSIDRLTLDNLREGDVVHFRHKAWPEGAYVEGPLYRSADSGELECGAVPITGKWGWADRIVDFKIVKEAPRFYVNANREPVVGDLATTIDHIGKVRVGPWFYTDRGWVSHRGTPIGDPQNGMPKGRSILLYDGKTRKPMPEWPADDDDS